MVDFGILGLLEVRTPEGPVEISGRHHPRLLAILLDQANRVVPTERLIEGLWDDQPPATAVRQVQNIASALRRRLGTAGERLRKVGTGYRIDVETDELDVLRCERAESSALRHRAAGRLGEAERALHHALSEWRGPSLTGLSGKALEASARRLDDYRLTLTEERIDIGLRLGRHELLVNELRRLSLEHPHRQRFTELLMLALYRCGLGPEALRVYTDVCDRLAAELGVDPGRPLRDLHTAILREDPSLDVGTQGGTSTIAPLTLPAGTAAFAGRSGTLAVLEELADAPSVPLVVLTGAGGVGKTMLALHWGHRSADRFPGGRIYLDLRGFTPFGPTMEPTEAARLLLGSMGVEPRRIPVDPDALVSLYRSIIGDERRLLILDNARDATQIRPLLPNSSNVHTVVTSRRQLTGLAVSHGARIIEVGALNRNEALSLLGWQLGGQRLEAEPESVERILTACAGVPLALAIAAAKAMTQPGHPLSAIADELETSRLDALTGGDESVDLRAVFSWSYRFLEADTARMFRLLGTLPGPDFGIDSATHLHGGTREEAARALRQLTDAHMVEHGRPGRYRLHDLLGLYAAELVRTEEPDHERSAASARLLGWYLHTADACRSLLYPEFEYARLPIPRGSDEDLPRTEEEAARWMKAEWTNLVAAVEHAVEHGPPHYAWLLADALRGYVWLGMLGSDGLRISRAALAAATSAGDHLGQASAELGMACALIRCNRVGEAMEHGRAAADLARRTGWAAGEASAEGNLASGAFYAGRMREGIGHARAALNVNRTLGDRRAQCTNLHWLGILHSLVDKLDTGIEYFGQALTLAGEAGTESVKAVLLTHMAEIELFRGRLDLAGAHLDKAAELERDGLGFDRSGDIEGATARLWLAAGRTEEALAHAKGVVETRTDAADHRIRTSAMVTLAAAHDAAGGHGEAIAHYDRVLDATEHGSTMLHRVEAMVGKSRALYRRGDADRAEAQAVRALRAAREGDYRFLEGQALNQLAEIELQAGRLRSAVEKADRALSACRQTGHRPGEAVALSVISRVALAEGDAQTARRYRDEARALYTDMGAAIPEDLADQR
ncbi:AfsR/SARP family transcriptional regulator [Nocardiopsis aegyptia]|uniref:DNA-binding SARP family transcriptional activator/tetratricopeptide (TPR) repeat protein n=1 Tax=Nocardiopsis aegyptia TaxID=220378 RepID=A0A7Z0EMS8_9ACTN|nr:BTAD domain-containing putative transcriptional regulator [Nocardiopsis aegyptia]NYJ34764.1 DNA-binding SARP family transcriptional activator/tetratricopeptide (TPR) repeat protein [Nocardiopsis aegyptia]